MRAVLHRDFGEPSEVLTVETVPLPEPGPGQVRIRTVLSPIHNHNLWTIRGIYGVRPDLPARAGTEAVGVVEALGDGVHSGHGVTVGQRVATGDTFGVWAEHFTAQASDLVPVPDALEDAAAAQLVSMPLSALTLLESLDVREGEWVVQNAANGTVGRLLAQLGTARGVNVVGLVRRTAAVEELAAQGIGNVVATESPQWRRTLADITAGGRVVAGVDSVGGTASGDLASVLAQGGTLVVFGGMQSPVLQIPSGSLMFDDVRVKGFWSSRNRALMPRGRRDALLDELVRHLRNGVLTLPVEATYPFEQVHAAVAVNALPGRAGKVLLRP